MKYFLSFFLFASLAISSCSKDPMEILYGTWNVTKVEAESTISGEKSTADASGTFTFNEDGTGSLNYSFTILGISSNSSGSFEWSANDNTLTLNGGQPDAMSFERIENKKNKQVFQFEIDVTVDVLIVKITLEM